MLSRYSKSLVTALTILAPLAFYQNCGQANFNLSDEQSSSLSSSSLSSPTLDIANHPHPAPAEQSCSRILPTRELQYNGPSGGIWSHMIIGEAPNHLAIATWVQNSSSNLPETQMKHVQVPRAGQCSWTNLFHANQGNNYEILETVCTDVWGRFVSIFHNTRIGSNPWSESLYHGSIALSATDCIDKIEHIEGRINEYRVNALKITRQDRKTELTLIGWEVSTQTFRFTVDLEDQNADGAALQQDFTQLGALGNDCPDRNIGLRFDLRKLGSSFKVDYQLICSGSGGIPKSGLLFNIP